MRSIIQPPEAAQALTEAIAYYAPMLRVPAGINAIAVLRAIAAQETTDPTRTRASKHEVSYCYGGPYNAKAVRETNPGMAIVLEAAEHSFGCAVHESWGPWQIMYATAVSRGFRGDPVLLRDPMTSGEFVVKHLNARVFDRLTDETIVDVFDAWNSGTPRDARVPEEYIKEAVPLYNHFNGGASP